MRDTRQWAFCEYDMSCAQFLHRTKLPGDFSVLSPAIKNEPNYMRLEEANLYYTAATGLTSHKIFRPCNYEILGCGLI